MSLHSLRQGGTYNLKGVFLFISNIIENTDFSSLHSFFALSMSRDAELFLLLLLLALSQYLLQQLRE